MKRDKNDILFSLIIRIRDKWTCQRCGKKYPEKHKGLHCSHYKGRANHSTRFDEENCIALCYGCHKYFDNKNPLEYDKFKLNQLGPERLEALVRRGNDVFRWDGLKDSYKRRIDDVYAKLKIRAKELGIVI